MPWSCRYPHNTYFIYSIFTKLTGFKKITSILTNVIKYNHKKMLSKHLCFNHHFYHDVKFEVFMAMITSCGFWVVVPCSVVVGHPEGGGSTVLWNIGIQPPHHTTLHSEIIQKITNTISTSWWSGKDPLNLKSVK